MPYNTWAKFRIGGQAYEHATFINGIGHQPADTSFVIGGPDAGPHYAPHERPTVEPDRDSWSVELPLVLWMLDQVEREHLTPARMRELLVEATAPRSGCCYACDDIRESEKELLAHLSDERQKWITWWNTVTPDTHPYMLSGSKIHRWDCHTVAHAQPEPPPVYRSKHEYVTGSHRPLNQDIFGHYRRATVDEACKWLHQFRRRAHPPRCKVCAPELPGSWHGEVSDVPSTR